MIGVKNMIVVVEVWARRRSGTAQERNRTSSVIGPYNKSDCVFYEEGGLLTATILRYPIHPLTTALRPRRRIQSRHLMRWSALIIAGIGLPVSIAQSATNVETEHMIQDTVTDCIRPRMTEGASRDSCGEGRVVGDM